MALPLFVEETMLPRNRFIVLLDGRVIKQLLDFILNRCLVCKNVQQVHLQNFGTAHLFIKKDERKEHN